MNDRSANNAFTAALSVIFGVLAWAQLPALCGFMFTSTRAGAGNYHYSMVLGGFLASLGLASSLRSILFGPRRPLLLAGAALSIAFLVTALVAAGWYGESCHAFLGYMS